MVSPAAPGLFFCFAAMVLLIFASVSPPAWDKVNFLTTNAGGDTTVFGMLGYCIRGAACTRRDLGYNLNIPGAANTTLNSTVLHNLTYTLILHPIAGAFAFFGLIFGLLGVAVASRVCTILMALCAALGAIIALVIFVIDMVLWNVLRNRLRDAGYEAMLGNANWLTLGALVALWLAMCSSVCGACGRFATGRMAGEKVGDKIPAPDYLQRQRNLAVLRESAVHTAPTYTTAYAEPAHVVATPVNDYSHRNNIAPSYPPSSTYQAR